MDPCDLRYTKHNELDSDFCDSVIDKFDSDETKSSSTILVKDIVDGQIQAKNTVDTYTRNSTSLHISGLDNWEEENEVFRQSISKNLIEYNNMCGDTGKGIGLTPLDSYMDIGYEIIRYGKDGFYQWHNDYDVNFYYGINSLWFTWHLNTLKSSAGGQIEFLDGTKIVPQQGKLTISPVHWTYSSRVKKVLTNRSSYIVSAFLYARPALPPDDSQTGTSPKQND